MQTFCRKKQNFLLKKERPGRKIPPGLCSVSVGMLFCGLAALAQAFEQEAHVRHIVHDGLRGTCAVGDC